VEGVRNELLCLRVEVGELIVSHRDRVCATYGRRRALPRVKDCRAWSGVCQRSRRACGSQGAAWWKEEATFEGGSARTRRHVGGMPRDGHLAGLAPTSRGE
jgi:hypothetical protein